MSAPLPAPEPADPLHPFDLAHVKAQEAPKRALEVSAAGGHTLLLAGPAGAGKTLLARCFPSLLPLLTEAEAAEIAERYRRAGFDPPPGRPFRAPPSTLRPSELVGRHGTGKAALAAGGVLFLDNLPAFGRRSLRALRELLEEPASPRPGKTAGEGAGRYLLVAAMRPCPCGGGSETPSGPAPAPGGRWRATWRRSGNWSPTWCTSASRCRRSGFMSFDAGEPRAAGRWRPASSPPGAGSGSAPEAP